MAFLPGIFGTAPKPTTPAPAAAQQPSQGGPASQQQSPANPAANPAAMNGQSGAAPAGGPQAAPATGLDAFTNLFAPKAADPNAKKAPTMADPILGPLDPAAFKQQIATANFAANIPQERMQAALQGDVNAFSEVINTAAREAFAAAAQLSHGLVENGVRTGADRLSSTLDSRFRDLQLRNQNTSNATLTHPAVAPVLNAVKMQIAASNPNLAPSEVQQQAEAYFTQMATALNPNTSSQDASANQNKQGDFAYLLEQ
jgi:hypothetical protein